MKEDYDFWKKWSNISDLEKEAIKTIKNGKSIILKNLPKEKIVAIYVGGSFVRRELNNKSDVDIWVILKDSKLFQKAKFLHNKYRYLLRPEIGIQAYSIKEFETGKAIGKIPKVNPTKFLKRIDSYRIIYGKKLDPNKFPTRTEEEEIKRTINFLKSGLIPKYEKEKKDFSGIVKQTFWLADLEQRIKGITPPQTWEGLSKSFKNEDHIIHDAWLYRKHPTKDKKLRFIYIKKLKKYISKLEKEIK
jgi:predicted nucleotidyltransferase